MAQQLRFASAYYDAELTLYKMGARYYDPRIGRFLQPDPAGMSLMSPTTWDLYAYAGNNPVNWTDPTGMFCYSCVARGAAKHVIRSVAGNQGYIDFNLSIGLGGGVTWGVMVTTDAWYPYSGYGIMIGPSGAVTTSVQSPTVGWNCGIQVGADGGSGQVGWAGNLPFYEVGLGTPGVSATCYNVYPGNSW